MTDGSDGFGYWLEQFCHGVARHDINDRLLERMQAEIIKAVSFWLIRCRDVQYKQISLRSRSLKVHGLFRASKSRDYIAP